MTDHNRVNRLFEKWVEEGRARHVCIANVHCLVMALRDKQFSRILRSADLLTMDGQPMRWYVRVIHGVRVKDRITGSEVMLRSIEYGTRRGWRHFFLGSTEKVLQKLQKILAEKYDGIKIVGAYSPPFRPLTPEEDAALVDMINNARPDLLWVGLGAPKQEKWIFDHLSRVHVPVQIGVGAAFDFHSGNIKRAPKFLQRIGLEWLYRIYRDPRLWERYLKTNPIFMFIFMRDFIKVKLLKNRR